MPSSYLIASTVDIFLKYCESPTFLKGYESVERCHPHSTRGKPESFICHGLGVESFETEPRGDSWKERRT